MLMGRSRLGDESREDGLDDKDRDDLGLRGGPAKSSGYTTTTKNPPKNLNDYVTLTRIALLYYYQLSFY